jgi:NADPH2:quinone reductase
VRAIVLSEFGPPDTLVLRDVPAPSAGEGQVLIDVEFANITFVETQVRAGAPPDPAMLPTLPVVPGNGVGGTVVALGGGVSSDLLGARAVTSTGGSGGYAEQVSVDAAGLVLVPEELGMAEAVALLADGRTAVLLVEAVGLDAGDTALVEAAAGGVGSLLVQLARNRGARVVAAAGDDRKLGLARELGADLTVNYREADWPAQVRTQLPDGVDVAFDGVGGAIGRTAFELVRAGGRYAPFGMASGAFTVLSDGEANSRRVRIVRLPPPAPSAGLEATRWVLTEAAAGRLRPVIGQRYPLADAAGAHAAIEARDTVGKTLLVVAGGAG